MIRLLLVALLTMTVRAPLAAQFCSVAPPELQGTRLVVSINCLNEASGSGVQYPATSLYVGATLYRLPTEVNGKIAPVDYNDPQISTLDLPAVTLSAVRQKTQAMFDLRGNSDFSHVLVAVWDKKADCSACTPYPYTLGRVGSYDMPIPIDAWPRPICAKNELQRAGFFGWIPETIDLGLEWADRRMYRLYSLNDCWELTGAIGLGYSVRRWRVGPLPVR